jgi:hypothetical protein
MDETFSLTIGRDRRIIEIRSNPMPDSGIVTTYADITERVAADMALKQANETLEQRVTERTAELTRVNQGTGEGATDSRGSQSRQNPLSRRRRSRHFAAASTRPGSTPRRWSNGLAIQPTRKLVQNIDSSLESVETILGARCSTSPGSTPAR